MSVQRPDAVHARSNYQSPSMADNIHVVTRSTAGSAVIGCIAHTAERSSLLLISLPLFYTSVYGERTTPSRQQVMRDQPGLCIYETYHSLGASWQALPSHIRRPVELYSLATLFTASYSALTVYKGRTLLRSSHQHLASLPTTHPLHAHRSLLCHAVHCR